MDSVTPRETSAEMHARISSEPIQSCGYCAMPFVPRVRWQIYCCDGCRTAHHKGKRENGPAGVRGALHDMRPLKGGKWSVIIHVDAVEAAALVKLQKGALVGIVE